MLGGGCGGVGGVQVHEVSGALVPYVVAVVQKSNPRRGVDAVHRLNLFLPFVGERGEKLFIGISNPFHPLRAVTFVKILAQPQAKDAETVCMPS